MFGRTWQVWGVILFTVFCPVVLRAQGGNENLLRQLLDLPAPPPVAEKEEEKSEKLPRYAMSFDEKEFPADDAPIEDLLAYWSVQAETTFLGRGTNVPKLSVKSAERLLGELENTPEKLDGFLKHLPTTPEIAGQVKEIFDLSQNAGGIDDDWRKTVKSWLKHNSRFYLDQLAAEASLARDQEKYGSVDKDEELKALARVDREAARNVLKKLENDPANPRTSALAKTLLYKTALFAGDDIEAEKYRDELKKIISDRNAPAFARDSASDALFETDWPGRDDFYLSLMEDESLLFPREKITLYRPLTTLPEKYPDKWIPILSKLVESPNRAVHNAAVQSLMRFENRKDALKPLLPWLADPGWADINWSPGGRITLMQVVSNVDLPESVPGLIWIVENEDLNAHWAAGSLAKFRDPRAAAALKNALKRLGEETYRSDIVEALIACGGLSADEQLAALEFYAEYISKPDNFKKIENRNPYEDEDPLPIKVSIGRFLSVQTEPAEDLIRRAFERQKVLRREKPEVARILSDFMTRWEGRLVDLEMLRKISGGEADAETILGALARRADLRKNVPADLFAMRGRIGLPAGIAACVLEDENELLSAFRRSDDETRISVLACARLIRSQLPVREVGGLLGSRNKLLALAAERYLESEDGPEARGLVLARHPGEALILGARTSFNPAKTKEFSTSLGRLFASTTDWYMNALYPDFSAFSGLDKFEDGLRREVLENDDLLEVYSIVPTYVVRVFRDRTVFTWYEDEARFRQRVLKPEELADLKNWIRESEIEETPPLFGGCHYTCGMLEYVRINRNGGRRFFAYTDVSSFVGLPFAFQKMRESSDSRLRYYLQDKIEGLEVLWADENLKPKAVWKEGDDLRVLIADREKESQIDEEISRRNKIDEENGFLDYDQKRKRARERRAEREYEHFGWRSFKDGRLGDRVEEPVEIPYLRDKTAFASVEDLNSNDSIWQAGYENFEIRTGFNYDTYGLWKVDRSGSSRIAAGWFGGDVFVSGDWAVAAKTDENWAVPNYVVRVDLKTGKEYKIDLPPADNFYPVALVPAHNKVLLYRASDERTQKKKSNPSPKTPEFYLLDAATGKTELIAGEFRPLIDQTFRSLQPTGKPDEYWAAIYDEAKNKTEIGRYNVRRFDFKSVLTVPEINLGSMDIWVDEKEGRIYIVYQGQLLSVPLTKAEE
ncbi:MAG: hypothetical protein R2747_01975 [Pyrinomonadaceae bacterium]